MDLNVFERALAAMSPQWGARRLGNKLAFEQVRSIARDFEVRGYDAARRGRRTNGWFASGGSPNAEMVPALNLAIRRSRDLVRNNEWAKNARRKWVAHAVGTGIAPRPDLPKGRAKDTANDA
jgi:capsid protein